MIEYNISRSERNTSISRKLYRFIARKERRRERKRERNRKNVRL